MSVYNGLQWCNTESTVQSTATPGFMLTRGSHFCLCPRTRGIQWPPNQLQSLLSAAHFPITSIPHAGQRTWQMRPCQTNMQLIGHALQFLRAWRLASGKPHLRARCRNRRYMHMYIHAPCSSLLHVSDGLMYSGRSWPGQAEGLTHSG